MPQVLIEVPLNTFINALDYNRGHNQAYRESLSSGSEIALKVAEAYHEYKKDDRVLGMSQLEHKAKLSKFYREQCRLMLAYEGSTPVGGYAVLQGELLAFHNVRKGCGTWMLDRAVVDGAERLDCFAVPRLVELYSSRGFKEVRREAHWSDSTKPDVVWMELTA